MKTERVKRLKKLGRWLERKSFIASPKKLAKVLNEISDIEFALSDAEMRKLGIHPAGPAESFTDTIGEWSCEGVVFTDQSTWEPLPPRRSERPD